jgi:Amt family ammonium transporter
LSRYGRTWGAIATGIFASVSVIPAGADGLIHGNFMLVLKQILAVVVVWVFAFVVTWLLAKLVDVTMGLRSTNGRKQWDLMFPSMVKERTEVL